MRGKGKMNGHRSGNDRLTRAAEERVRGRHMVEGRGMKTLEDGGHDGEEGACVQKPMPKEGK